MARNVRRDRAIFVPTIGSQLVATTSAFVLPFVVGALISGGGFSEGTAGYLLSMEAIAAALTTLAVSAWTMPRSRRKTAVIGAGLAAAGNALSLISPDLSLLMVARLIAGIGAGIVTAEASAVVARGLDREKLISGLTIAAIVNGALWLMVIPVLMPLLGYRAPYLALLLTCITGIVLLTRLPDPKLRKTAQAKIPSGAPFGLALAVLPAIFLTQLGQGSFWTLVGLYGTNAHLDDATIGAFLSFATLLLLVGVAGTAWIGVRAGRFLPMLGLMALNVVSIVTISYSTDPNIYFAANAIQALTNLSSLVFQLGLAAAVDRTSGRLFAAANGLVALGNGVGPAVAGALAGPFGAPNVALAVVGFNSIAVALFLLVRMGVAQRSISLRS
jgi:predicted MFS family arabinose efflux permease